MNIQEILAHVDHTLLTQTAVWEEIRKTCEDAVSYHTAGVCLPPCYVKQAADLLKKVRPADGKGGPFLVTTIGFPNGNETTETKKFETEDALRNGAEEIDMVINIGWLKEGHDTQVEREIREIKEICQNRILKVIVEACLLTEEEKIRACQIVTASGADYIKTSTGFSAGGATFADVMLFAEHVGPDVKIKAAGGISSLEDAEKFLELGADRLGTSRIIKLVKAQEGK